MPSVRYYNQTAPFWDFVASLESAGAEHPFFSAFNPGSNESHDRSRSQQQGPSHDSGAPSTSHAGPEGASPPGPPPPPEPHSPEGPPPGSPPFGHPHPRHFWGPHHGGWGGRGRRGGFGGHRGHHHGGPPSGGWPNGDFDMSKIAEFIGSQLGFGGSGSAGDRDTATGAGKDFQPAADVFDAEDAYTVHVSLPGAKKEDVGVNWDADKSELSVAGVIYRPGSEEFLKTLALDERKVGVFERKVRLGSRASPAQVDVDGISAKMEDGILMVNIPKEDKDFVDVKKVDIE